MGVFADNAWEYHAKGLSPLPIMKGEKRPAINNWQRYCTEQATPEEMAVWLKKYANNNIGLALGTIIGEDGDQLIAVDVDDDGMVDVVRVALNYPSCHKKGKKGITFFMRGAASIKNEKIKRVDENGKPTMRPSVEILARGSQTVIPPSRHPDGMDYVWTGAKLLDVIELEFLSAEAIDEITAHCHGRGEHFVALNTMVWLGEGGGGNTHDVCVAAVACMVGRGWPDNQILARIERAKKASVERAGQKYDWPRAVPTIQGWIESARAKGMDKPSEKKKKAPAERIMAEWAIEKLGGPDNVATVNGVIRAYDRGHWPEVSVGGLMKEMYQFDSMLRKHEAESAMAIVATLTERTDFGTTPGVDDPHMDPKKQRVCLANGTVELTTGKLEQWDPNHEILHQLPFAWDDEAECPVYERVINQTFAGDEGAARLWDEFAAHTLIDDMTFQKLLFLRGPGGNGKGTLARVLRGMHDPRAVGSVAITDLNDERKRTSLVGKLVNISGEQSRLNLVSDTYLKKITGGDPIDVRRLYGETKNNVVLSVRFVELVNEMPATSDNSYALRRRIIILDCPNKVATPDLHLDHKLRRERPAILRRWVEALARLLVRKEFDIPESSSAQADEYIRENNPIEIWVEEEVDRLTEGGTPSRELYAHFAHWAKAMGHRFVPSGVEWGRRMAALGMPTIIRNTTVGEVKIRRAKIKAGREVGL